MRKIEEQMLQAIQYKENWSKDNTQVVQNNDSCRVYLYGHHICTVDNSTRQVLVNKATLASYPTVTTKSRLRALGCNVYTKEGITYLDDKELTNE